MRGFSSNLGVVSFPDLETVGEQTPERTGWPQEEAQ